jgi:hypothetical protein
MWFLALGLLFTAFSFISFFFIENPIYFKVSFVIAFACNAIYFIQARKHVKRALE